MTDTDEIYREINKLRTDAITRDYKAGELGSHPLDVHLAVAGLLSASDWTDDGYGQRVLGNPEDDWCVTIDGDTVTVWAAGAVEATAIVNGAGQL